MEQKRINSQTFEWIRKLGYFGKTDNIIGFDEDDRGNITVEELWSREDGEETVQYLLSETYIDVWLWLWRVKKFEFAPCRGGIDVAPTDYHTWVQCYNVTKLNECEDPEDAIIIAIDYLRENDLVK